MNSDSLLFSPVRLGVFDLPNRILMAPMTRNRALPDGTPVPIMADYYVQRASAGLIISEMTEVSAGGVSYANVPGLYQLSHVEGWSAITDAVHKAGGQIAVQLAHGGRISHPALLPDGLHPVAPSALRPEGSTFTAQGAVEFVTPRELAAAEIQAIVDEFAAAARLAKEAGFDGVELHAANGYLVDQFLRDGANHRQDEYGGTAARRVRFLTEVVSAMARAWDPARIGVRLSPWSPFNSMSDSNPEETFLTVARALGPLGLAFLHVIEPANLIPAGTAALTPRLREAFGGPVIANGGLTPESAELLLTVGAADAASFGVPFLANPDLPARFAGREPLNTPDPATFYQGGVKGYTDYPGSRAAGR